LIAEDDFYDEDPPRQLQQGDVLVGVPLLLLPKGEELLLLRAPRSRTRVSQLPSGLVEVVREKALNDAFDEAEFVGADAVRTLAVLMTQTCDLVQKRDFWNVAMLQPLDDSIDRANLYAGYYQRLFPYPKHEHFDESLLDITEMHAIRPENVDIGNRVASVKSHVHQLLAERFLRTIGRRWGHAEGDEVPADGKYRCLGCNNFDMPICEVPLTKGEKFPSCPCTTIRRHSQWYPLQKPKSKQLAAVPRPSE